MLKSNIITTTCTHTVGANVAYLIQQWSSHSCDAVFTCQPERPVHKHLSTLYDRFYTI